MTTGIQTQEKENRLLSDEERDILGEVATKDPPFSQRAQALLAIDEGTTQAAAGQQAGLTKGQVRYWLGKFRKDGTSIFPDEVLNQPQQEDAEEAPLELADEEEAAGPVVEATEQKEDKPEAKKKSGQNSKKKSKKAKKAKKPKKAKKGKKAKKKSKKKDSKKKGSKKAKGKSGKKKGK